MLASVSLSFCIRGPWGAQQGKALESRLDWGVGAEKRIEAAERRGMDKEETGKREGETLGGKVHKRHQRKETEMYSDVSFMATS